MSFTDPIGDMIARIRNAQMRTSNNVAIPNSKFRVKIIEILKQEGYISDYKIISSSTKKDTLLVDLKYNNGLPVIKEIKRVSKPGRRIYARASSIPKIQNGLGISIMPAISQSQMEGLGLVVRQITINPLIKNIGIIKHARKGLSLPAQSMWDLAIAHYA